MEQLNEAELTKYMENSAVTSLEIIELEDTNFILKVHLNWKNKPCILASYRRSTRRWANLNNLIKFIKGINKENLRVPISINIFIRGNDEIQRET